MTNRVLFVAGVVCGILGTAMLRGGTSRAQNAAAGAAAATTAAGGVVVRLDESKTALTYVNAYRIHQNPEEVVLDIGFNMANPNSEKPNPNELIFTVSNRVVLTWANAKRLQGSLAAVVKRHEDENGAIVVPEAGRTPPKP